MEKPDRVVCYGILAKMGLGAMDNSTMGIIKAIRFALAQPFIWISIFIGMIAERIYGKGYIDFVIQMMEDINNIFYKKK